MSGYLIERASGLGVGLVSSSSLNTGTPSDPVYAATVPGSYVSTLLCLEALVSLVSSVSTGSYNLSASPSVGLP